MSTVGREEISLSHIAVIEMTQNDEFTFMLSIQKQKRSVGNYKILVLEADELKCSACRHRAIDSPSGYAWRQLLRIGRLRVRRQRRSLLAGTVDLMIDLKN